MATFEMADLNEDTLLQVMDFCKSALDAASAYNATAHIDLRMSMASAHIDPIYEANTCIRLALIGHVGRTPHIIRTCENIIHATKRTCEHTIERKRRSHMEAA